MNTLSLAELQALAPQLPEKIPYLKMLVLFGSRARGDFHSESDWDFAALYDEEIRKKHIEKSFWNWLEVPGLLIELFNISEDKIDVVELNKSSSIISHFIARDGKLLYERNPGEFKRFKERALLESAQIKIIREAQQEKIEMFLQSWGV
ncbi:type VII toxin-antitoxin system MntA family adenylyltransferase antitoxin [Laspinema olomoucense]|uniref:type VII toxin-antitoxin system MntA family adenylyltransferase antitoxin n=1 Tax=Laspinema olomoucense TaxID=3231600 RepID=UPI0021BB3E87|nr:nucleotidyltransferase domain-containing protein [Laspinema sp. D3c]MCT7995786.1 nucleotidyltransferase domain-containing protein [Laspinema sp. D3c]